MAVKSGPNSTRRKADARKKGKCQLCGAKTQPAKAKSVVVDPPGVGEVKVVKAREGKSFWCSDCAKKKAASYERAIERKRENGETGSKRKAKKAAPKKAAGRKRPAAKKATAKKAPARKRGATKAKGKRTRSAAEPF